MAYAAATDLLTMRISNRVSLGLCLAFLVIAPIAGMSGQQMLMHLGVGAAMLGFGMVLFALRLFGGGDTKLFAAAALWVGYDQLAPFVAYVTIFGGALAILLLAYRSIPVGAFPLPGWAARLHHRGEGMPYGVAIAAGALMIFPQTVWQTLLAG
jgi:prepilin peptidase CpaA